MGDTNLDRYHGDKQNVQATEHSKGFLIGLKIRVGTMATSGSTNTERVNDQRSDEEEMTHKASLGKR